MYDKSKHDRSLLYTILTPLLFLAPEDHLREMEKLRTDEVIIESVWRNHAMMQLGEWGDTILWVRIQSHIQSTLDRPSHVMATLVDSNANGERRLSCHPWRSHFKS